MKILLVEDHCIIRVFLKTYLAEHYPKAEIESIKSFNTTLVEEIIKHSADIVILDISLDKMDALDFFSDLKMQMPQSRFIIYTMHNITSYKRFFWNAGASAYVLKEEAHITLKDVIRRVLLDERIFPPGIEQEETDYRLHQLTFTETEKQLLRGLIDNLDSIAISELISCSKKDVLNLRRKLLDKSGAKNTQQLVTYALDYNWIR